MTLKVPGVDALPVVAAFGGAVPLRAAELSR